MTDPAELAGLLATWLPERRWYATKHLTPRIESVVVSAPARVDDGPEFLEVVVTDRPADARIVYQVPLVRRAVLPDGVHQGAVLGRDREGRWLTDAAHESAYLRRLLPRTGIAETRVLAGEQSNTSVICESADGPFDVIVKLFRVLDEGSNPEVDLQEALSGAGSPHVPRFVGAGWGGWTRGGSGEFGHLWVASEFIDGAEDAWRVAGAAVARGEEVDAEGLGRAVAEVHLALARELPTVSVDDAGLAAVVGAWRQRARLANAAVPALAQYRERVARVYEAAEHAAWPELQ
nr:hypothetical protein [Actinomycetales bacterium]